MIQLNPLTFSLADVITQGPPTLDEHTLKEKHPAVHFWTKVDYDVFTLSPESQGLDCGKAPWLELENGDPLTSQQLSAVQTTLCSAWAKLVQCKLALPTWTKVSTSGKELIYEIMVKKHPLFALDNDRFKLKMLCVTDYPKWCKNHLTPTGKWKDASSSKAPLKEESEEASDGAVISLLDLKGKKCESDDGGGLPLLSHPHPHTKQSKGTTLDFLCSVTNYHSEVQIHLYSQPPKNQALCSNKKASGYLILALDQATISLHANSSHSIMFSKSMWECHRHAIWHVSTNAQAITYPLAIDISATC
ncbi:hypothetical protein M404DRAFT_11108 [Pisolithus tinctorius Marx 270]|uniref:Uncharacterized protein n=1 Tax=Pisolithus tinctorius Marx 270 TaxID=870435 RepID=A0A0C3NJU4_PISTI|nr:hypothetical protein M404DRAFT_11108 [Pisolithus tinctorius Marx 270]